MKVASFGRWCAAVMAIVLLWLLPQHATAQAGTVGTPIGVCIKRVATGSTAAALLARPAGFDCSSNQRHHGSGDFWAISRTLRVDMHDGVRIRTASLWQNGGALYARFADGRTLRLRGDGHATTARIQLGAIVEYRLPPGAASLTRLLWRIDGAANMRGILVAPRIATAAQSARSNLVLAAVYAGFAGLGLSLLLHNIALYGALRHRFQLAYCVMVSALLLYALSSSGALAWAWPGIANNDRLRVNYLALAVAGAAAVAFARCYFEARVFAGWLRRAVWIAPTLVLACGVAFAALAPWEAKRLDQAYATSFIALLATAVPILWRAWRLRSRYLALFALAWAGPIALATIRIANNTGFVGYSFFVDNSTLLAMALEALGSSLAIAYRIRLLSKERDEALEQEIAARLLADTDPLTGLLNRRAFLTRAIGRPDEQVLLLIDIDHFKLVNDTIGHDGGDEVLRIVARELRRAMPPGALVARMGGEEFVCLTDADDPARPNEVLDALRAARMPFDIAVTASIGRCTGPLGSDAAWKALYRRADRALFAAKAAGRDRARDAAQLAA